MSSRIKTIWGFPTLLCIIVFVILFVILWQRPITGCFIGFLMGQLLSLATLAIEDCSYTSAINHEEASTYKYFFSLWGQFFKIVFKYSIIGYGIFFGNIFFISFNSRYYWLWIMRKGY